MRKFNFTTKWGSIATKRIKFVVSSVLLSSGFVALNFLNISNRFFLIGGLTALTLVLFYWSLSDLVRLNSTLTALILPTLFTLGVGLFWFLIPASYLARLPIVILYGFGMYAIILTTNIYLVSSVKTIALIRAARGVGFVLSLLTSFLLFDAVFSIKAPIWAFALLSFAVSFPIFLQGLWSIDLKSIFAKKVIGLTTLSSISISEVALVLYFWPVTVVVGSLFLTASMYTLLGLGQAYIEGRLFKQTVRDYLTIAVVVLVAMFFATRWSG